MKLRHGPAEGLGISCVVMSEAPGMRLDPATLSRLRCPLTHSRLRQEGEWLVAEVGGLSYPIREGFACLLIEEAKLPPQYKTLEEFKAQFAQAVV